MTFVPVDRTRPGWNLAHAHCGDMSRTVVERFRVDRPFLLRNMHNQNCSVGSLNYEWHIEYVVLL
jgi:hypothetical protein